MRQEVAGRIRRQAFDVVSPSSEHGPMGLRPPSHACCVAEMFRNHASTPVTMHKAEKGVQSTPSLVSAAGSGRQVVEMLAGSF
jgi:hypothetical protein